MKCQSDGMRTLRCLCLQRSSGAEGVRIAPIYGLRPEVNYLMITTYVCVLVRQRYPSTLIFYSGA